MTIHRPRLRRALARVLALAVVPAAALGLGPAGQLPVQAANAAASNSCQLNSASGAIKHVIQLQFDNVHFRRDNANVPSDIEQMPNLYNFLVGNGVVLNNHHTPLVSHTGADILTTLTGVYPDRHGQPLANTFDFYGPDNVAHSALSFAYWTDFAQAFDGTQESAYNLVDGQGNNPPAPWVPFTRAGCNVGAVGTANIELERVANVATVYGQNSPQAAEAADLSDKGQAKTTADFIGVAVHCARGAGLCSGSNNGVPDVLPQEPGGYAGYNGLFGHKYVAPQIAPAGSNLVDANGNMVDLNGNVIQNFASDGTPYPGFPGFNGMQAPTALSYVAAMQEHGVPVTYAYLSAVHEHIDTGLGPGDPVYEQNLKSYDDAFGKFFKRLAADGINKSNTLFLIGSDENDFFVGQGASNPGCNGVVVTCNYDPTKLGSVEVAVDNLLKQNGVNTGFALKGDSAPGYYLNGNPGPNDGATRQAERVVSTFTVPDPLHNGQITRVTDAMADRPTLRALHMVTSDPLRTPTFVGFDNPEFEGVTAPLDCAPGGDPTVTVMQCQAVETWHHGDIQPQITNTWFGMVGPGVRNLGVNNSIWSDHTDIRPTMMALVGLKDDYRHDGRVILEALDNGAVNVVGNRAALIALGALYKQLDAPVGAFGTAVVQADTRAVQSGSAADDSQYLAFEQQLNSLTNVRNNLALQISQVLDAGVGPLATGAFNGQAIPGSTASSLAPQTRTILARAKALAAG